MPNGTAPTPSLTSSAASNTLCFYVPDLAPAIRLHVGDKRGGLVDWFRGIATRDLIANGALGESEEAIALKEFREALATQGPKAVRAKISELAGQVVEISGEARA